MIGEPGEQLKSGEQKQEDSKASAETSAPTSNVQEGSLEKAQASNDDRAVEAAGKEGGLKAALAARLNTMSEAAARERQFIKEVHGNIDSGFMRRGAKPISMAFEGMLGLAQKTIAALRDRLKPATKLKPNSSTS